MPNPEKSTDWPRGGVVDHVAVGARGARRGRELRPVGPVPEPRVVEDRVAARGAAAEEDHALASLVVRHGLPEARRGGDARGRARPDIAVPEPRLVDDVLGRGRVTRRGAAAEEHDALARLVVDHHGRIHRGGRLHLFPNGDLGVHGRVEQHGKREAARVEVERDAGMRGVPREGRVAALTVGVDGVGLRHGEHRAPRVIEKREPARPRRDARDARRQRRVPGERVRRIGAREDEDRFDLARRRSHDEIDVVVHAGVDDAPFVLASTEARAPAGTSDRRVAGERASPTSIAPSAVLGNRAPSSPLRGTGAATVADDQP